MTHSQLNGEDATALREENRCLKNTLKQYCGSENMNRSNVANGFDFQRELQVGFQANKLAACTYSYALVLEGVRKGKQRADWHVSATARRINSGDPTPTGRNQVRKTTMVHVSVVAALFDKEHA